jgi:hypothetical protein
MGPTEKENISVGTYTFFEGGPTNLLKDRFGGPSFLRSRKNSKSFGHPKQSLRGLKYSILIEKC